MSLLATPSRAIWFPPGRCCYTVVLEIDGRGTEADLILRERYMTGAEVSEVAAALRRTPRVTDWRIKRHDRTMGFEKGVGDLLRVVGQLTAHREPWPVFARRVRDAGGNAWDRISDPDACIREMRGYEPEQPANPPATSC